jgi:hypothetical protein
LFNCLNSIFKQNYSNFEVILVDNASTDNSVDYVKRNYPQVLLKVNTENSGFAEGNNIGYKISKGKYILLLNTDTRIPTDFVSKLVNKMEASPKVGVIQPKLVLMDNPETIDTSGSFWTSTTFLYHYGYGKNSKALKYNSEYPVFSIKGAAMITRRQIIDRIGLFDENFWNYYEETDFCHRVWISGSKVLYWPGTECFHAMGGTSLVYFDKSYIQFHNFKNKLLSFIKNFEIKILLFVVPKFLVINFVLSVVWIVNGKLAHAQSLYRATWWNIVNLSGTLKKRNNIQKHRVMTDEEIFKKVKINPKLSYYLFLFQDRIGKYED